MSATAKAFAEKIGARLTLPSRPLMQRQSAKDYYTETDVARTWREAADWRQSEVTEQQRFEHEQGNQQ